MNELVKETGQVYSATGRGLILYLTVPQDFKYNSKDNIQEFADKVLQVKNETFPVWLVENGYSAQDVSIRLHIKTEDGTVLAKEKVIGNNESYEVKNQIKQTYLKMLADLSIKMK